jgi:hypothetical protein
MRITFVVGSLVGLLAGCSADWPSTSPSTSKNAISVATELQLPATRTQKRLRGIADMPDRGALFEDAGRAPMKKGAYTWHAIRLSEEHALRGIDTGSIVVPTANGGQMRIKYERHIEHPDGNWTWVGRPEGSAPGQDAILTFGEKAVFGSIPQSDGEPLEVTSVAGHTWMIETDRALLDQNAGAKASAPDFVVPVSAASDSENAPSRASSAAIPQNAAPQSAEADVATPLDVVDLLIGYTSAFATRLGGQSQALTRLNFLVDVANEAYANSQLTGRLRLVHAMQVSYPDATSNRNALFELTGVNCAAAAGGQLPDGVGVTCTYVGQPASLQSLAAARELYGADLVSLVRNFSSPENQSCGLAWLSGGGQTPIDYNSASYGMSVVGDSNGTVFPDDGSTCRHETLVHELGHNMGLQHDRATAQGADDTNGDSNLLDPEEYGRYADAFGYRAPADAGNFYDVMAPRQAGQAGYRVFSNPRITFCGGFPCGVVGQADAARVLSLTMPGVATFRMSPPANVWFRGDYDGDGKSDLLWRNLISGSNVIWRSGNSATTQAVTAVAGQTWKLVGAADFDGNGTSDLLWRNSASGANVIWKSANSATPQAMTSVSGTAWQIVGAGDFDGDGKADVLWRNTTTGANGIWRSANSTTLQPISSVADQAWTVVGVADFNGDGKDDILWRNANTGANGIWRSGNASTAQAVTSVASLAWRVAAVGDFDGDNRADILWRNASTGANVLWKSANSSTFANLTGVFNPAWSVAAVGDFDGDNRDDVLWRNAVTGANGIWRSASSATPQTVTTVHLNWIPAG